MGELIEFDHLHDAPTREMEEIASDLFGDLSMGFFIEPDRFTIIEPMDEIQRNGFDCFNCRTIAKKLTEHWHIIGHTGEAQDLRDDLRSFCGQHTYNMGAFEAIRMLKDL